jgi:hypothetical protein
VVLTRVSSPLLKAGSLLAYKMASSRRFTRRAAREEGLELLSPLPSPQRLERRAYIPDNEAEEPASPTTSSESDSGDIYDPAVPDSPACLSFMGDEMEDKALRNPLFSGQRSKWPVFQDRFETYLTHNLFKVPATVSPDAVAQHKLQLLKGCFPLETASRAQYESFLAEAKAQFTATVPAPAPASGGSQGGSSQTDADGNPIVNTSAVTGGQPASRRVTDHAGVYAYVWDHLVEHYSRAGPEQVHSFRSLTRCDSDTVEMWG